MSIRLASGKTIFLVFAVISLSFIGFGDRFLPKPLSDYSRNTRSKIEQAWLQAFPNPDLEKYDLIEKREKDIRQLEKRVAPSSTPGN